MIQADLCASMCAVCFDIYVLERLLVQPCGDCIREDEAGVRHPFNWLLFNPGKSHYRSVYRSGGLGVQGLVSEQLW